VTHLDLIAIALAVYGFLPVYFANATPILAKGKVPIDLGYIFVDGKRLLGSNKTVRGFAVGLAVGTLTGLVQGSLVVGFLLSLGALLGDLCGAFLKRRLGLRPGAPLPVVDQLDFVGGAFLLVSIVRPPTFQEFLYLIILTPIIHLVTNIMAYLLKLKKEPW
jgi:CDP-2,3-bis-(O-geranylgeranyl)-sn-glycerol synthase